MYDVNRNTKGGEITLKCSTTQVEACTSILVHVHTHDGVAFSRYVILFSVVYFYHYNNKL
jgi:hypothetical protein